MGSQFWCAWCERGADKSDYALCADCKRDGCERCLSFAELPGYPLCENCAVAREEKNTPPETGTHRAPAEAGRNEGT